MRKKCVHPREQEQELLRGGSKPWSSAHVSQEPRLLVVTWGCCDRSHTPQERAGPWLLVSAWEMDSAPALTCPEWETKPFLSSGGWEFVPLCQVPCCQGLAAVGLEAWCPRGPCQGCWVTQKNWGKTEKLVQLMLLLKKSYLPLFTSPSAFSKLLFQACTIWCYMHPIWNTRLQPSPLLSFPAGISNTDSPGRGTVIVKQQHGLDFLQPCVCLSFQDGVRLPCHCWEHAMGVLLAFALAISAVS